MKLIPETTTKQQNKNNFYTVKLEEAIKELTPKQAADYFEKLCRTYNPGVPMTSWISECNDKLIEAYERSGKELENAYAKAIYYITNSLQ